MMQEPPVSLSSLGLSKELREPPDSRTVVCVQGLGFVGFAMAVAIASARDSGGLPLFHVIGVDLPTTEGLGKVGAINAGHIPIVSRDEQLQESFQQAFHTGNLVATVDERAFELAEITIVDIHLDLHYADGEPCFRLEGFRDAVGTLGKHMRPGSLIIVETTVPPGTCLQVAAPELAGQLERRGLPASSILLAHSYERVMPGREYLNSIVNFWRVYAGHTEDAADACGDFLSKVINVSEYPLTRLHSTTASEIAKVLENSYRAVNIAFIEEWARFAEVVGVDLFEVIKAIRVRPTHSNIRQPGFGVGGYCLTKDPLFASVASRQLFKRDDLSFPFSTRAIEVNGSMPLRAITRIRDLLGGSLAGKTLLLLGISYRSDVGDTRYSPSETFTRAAEADGARVIAHDPLVPFWMEMGKEIPDTLPSPYNCDAIVFAVSHQEYSAIAFDKWLGDSRPLIFDAAHVLTESQRRELRGLGCPTAATGMGENV
jgi:UDP-N-acetyl-D-glucosamine dehydrogenase